ncbi:methyltransferase domain-containing protein [Flavobacteriaceae bacterium]|nr:methyltransferase domain-containing protein [Flavobacteriaceae bacterium]
MNFKNISSFIKVDNKNWRQQNPAASIHFTQSELEAKSYKRNKFGIINDKNLINFRDKCPVCDSPKFYTTFVKWGFEYCSCYNCNSLFVKNILKNEKLMELYEKSVVDDAAYERTLNDTNISYYSKIYKKYLDILSDLTKNNLETSLLDFGCGSGLFVKTLLNHPFHNFNVYASEYYHKSYDELNPILGNKFFFQKSLDEIKKDNYSFDIVTLWGVLEHVQSPRSILAGLNNLINDQGYILFCLPNPNSRAIKILGVNTPTLNPREHLQFFSKESLCQLMKEYGFELCVYGQELPVIDLMWEYLPQDFNAHDDIIKNDEGYYQIYIFQKSVS